MFLRGLKILSKNFKLLHVLWVIGFVVTVSSCAPVVSTSSTIPRKSQPQQPEIPVKTPEKPGPRAMAALQLTEQGRNFLEKDISSLVTWEKRSLRIFFNMDSSTRANIYNLMIRSKEINNLAPMRTDAPISTDLKGVDCCKILTDTWSRKRVRTLVPSFCTTRILPDMIFSRNPAAIQTLIPSRASRNRERIQVKKICIL